MHNYILSLVQLFYLNLQPLEVVSRYRDPQPQVFENDFYLFDLRANIENIDVKTVISFSIPVV